MPSVVFEDHYTVLGVSPDATADEIKKAYRTLARRYHPDVLGSDADEGDRTKAQELFDKAAKAYEQLSNPTLRQQVDDWLGAWWVNRQPHQPEVQVPNPGTYLLGGVYCWVEFEQSRWFGPTLRARVTIQLKDLFVVGDFEEELPHDAWLTEVIAVDPKGDVVGRGYSISSLRHDVRRLQAEARRNESRRTWRFELDELNKRIQGLAGQKPVNRLRRLASKTGEYIESGQSNTLRWRPEHPDTITKALKELEKAIRHVESTSAIGLLMEELLNGNLKHPDLEHNAKLLAKLRVYEFRTGGEYTAPTDDGVAAFYRKRLTEARARTEDRAYCTNLRLPDDEPTILEMAAEGLYHLAPGMLEVPGNKGTKLQPVAYGFAKVDDEVKPVGVIEISMSAYERHGGSQHGQASKLPTLPHDITLLVRVKVKAGKDNVMVSHPKRPGKELRTEVSRCLARLRNPAPAEEVSFSFLLLPY